jgi:thiosulfate dehydrogenase (quinone) large subunit
MPRLGRPLRGIGRPPEAASAPRRLLDSGALRTAAVVRILTGLIFLAEGWSKLTGEFVRGGFSGDVKRMAAETWPFWKSFLETVVAPRAEVFGWAFALGELAVGIGLIVGLFTRVAAGGGIALMILVLLGSGRGEPGATWDMWVTAGLTAKFALLLLVLLFAVNPGKIWGLDGWISKRRPTRRPA